MKPEKYTSKTLDVEAIRITGENIEQIAIWCGGKFHAEVPQLMTKREAYIDLVVMGYSKGMEYYKKMAHVGDWIVRRSDDFEFEICEDEEFKKRFEAIEPKLPDAIDQILDGYDHPIFLGTRAECLTWLDKRPQLWKKLSVRVTSELDPIPVSVYFDWEK